MRRRYATVCLCLLLAPASAVAQPLFDAGGSIPLTISDVPGEPEVRAWVSEGLLSRSRDRKHILIVASPNEKQRSILEYVRQQTYEQTTTLPLRGKMTIGAAYADAELLTTPWPPESKTPYYSEDHRGQKLFWRSLFWLAPDLVIQVRFGDSPQLHVPEKLTAELAASLKRTGLPIAVPPADSLTSALAAGAEPTPKFGSIPGIDVVLTEANGVRELLQILTQLLNDDQPAVSPAHREFATRRERAPIEIARQLENVYGKHFDAVMYQPALALVGRLNLDDLLGERARHAEVERILAGYASGEKPTLGKSPNGSVTSGHLIFSELARRSDRERYLPLVLRAADQGFDAERNPLAAMPAHSEMSDAVFMGTPILAAAGRLTGDEKYFAMALRHAKFMQQHCLREDGLYRHSPLDEAAWGRGNGFPALGFAWAVSEIPAEHPVHLELRRDLVKHLAALVAHQDPTGMWHQVIDRPGSYREMTATCMTAFAMIRCLRNDWLDEAEYGPVVERAYAALSERIGADGVLFDVCTGTGKQKSLMDYYDRAAILGVDERGGAMALLVVTEYALWKQSQERSER